MIELQTSQTLIEAQRRAHAERAAVFAEIFASLGRMFTLHPRLPETVQHAA